MLHLTATDLEVGAHVVVAGKVEKEGAFTVPARQLVEYVQQLPETHPIQAEMKGQRLEVSTKGFRAQFAVSQSDDFPLLPIPEDKEPVALDSRLFGQALANTIFAAARDETRPELHSLFISGADKEVRVVATDSFRLAEKVLDYSGEKQFKLLLPLGAAQEVARLFGAVDEMELLTHKNYVCFKGAGIELSSRLIDGEYPDYQRIIPDKFAAEGVVEKSDLQRALKVLGVFLSRDSRRISMKVRPEKGVLELKVEGGESGQGQVEVDIEGQGSELEVLFNINYLLEGVTHISSGQSRLRWGGESDPLIISPEDGAARYLYVVMPIQH